MEENRISKRVLGTTRLRGKPRNRWEDEVREVGNLVGEKGWKERVYNREEWKKLRRVAKNSRILHMPMNDSGDSCRVCNDVTKLRSANVRLALLVNH